MPARIQRKRSAGWRKPEGAVYVGRGSKWGNPARLVRADHGLVIKFGTTGGAVGTWPADGAEARRYATELYRHWINDPAQAVLLAAAREQLTGRDLMCWCPPGQPCHADVLLALANPTA
jgi:Domain of unknown function (DUF4326)